MLRLLFMVAVREMLTPALPDIGIGDDYRPSGRKVFSKVIESLTDHDHGVTGMILDIHDFHNAFTHLSELFRLEELINFSATDSSKFSVVSHDMHSSVMDTPYCRAFRSPLNF